MRVLSLAPVNTAPHAASAPTVLNTDDTTGAVIGELYAIDIDGDPLTYNTITGPAGGGVTVSGRRH